MFYDRYPAFGKKDAIGFLRLKAMSEGGISKTVFYTKPSIEHFYSAYGFALPLQDSGIPLIVALHHNGLAGLFGDLPEILKPHTKQLLRKPLRWILVDHGGMLWKICVQPSIEKDQGDQAVITYMVIDRLHSGWWYTNEEAPEADDTVRKFMGFLYTDPTQEKITDYMKKYEIGSDVTWLNIPDIVEKLNKEYPRPTAP